VNVEYDSLHKLTDAIRTLDEHHIGWAAASATKENPFGDDYIVYRLYASEVLPG
jgi:hypothetical protein